MNNQTRLKRPSTCSQIKLNRTCISIFCLNFIFISTLEEQQSHTHAHNMLVYMLWTLLIKKFFFDKIASGLTCLLSAPSAGQKSLPPPYTHVYMHAHTRSRTHTLTYVRAHVRTRLMTSCCCSTSLTENINLLQPWSDSNKAFTNN